jgi:hypothetical protein
MIESIGGDQHTGKRAAYIDGSRRKAHRRDCGSASRPEASIMALSEEERLALFT